MNCATQVDTDVESVVTSDDEDDGGNEELIKPPVLPTKPDAEAKTTRVCTEERQSHAVIWQNNYFYIPERKPGTPGFRVFARSRITSHLGLGEDLRSRYLTPETVGEKSEEENCPLTLLLLRAWVLWRAHKDNWANQKESRRREFEEERMQLRREIKKIQDNNGGSLGHQKADGLWENFLRDPPWSRA